MKQEWEDLPPEQEWKNIPPPVHHKQFTDEEFLKEIDRFEIDRFFMMERWLHHIRNYGLLSDRQFNKSLKTLHEKGKEMGIYWASPSKPEGSPS